MWASTLLGPYVSDPMYLKLSKSYMGIFVGVNYGERSGGNIAGHNGLDERGGGESCMQIFSHGVEWWDRRGRRRVWQAYCFHTWRGKDLKTNGLPAGMGNDA